VASLSFSVKDIPPEGTRIACVVGREELQLEENDPGIQDVLALTATLHAEEANVRVEGELNGLLLHECVRCLEEFATPAALSFRALYKDLSQRHSKKQEPDAVPGDSDPEETDCHLVVEQRIALQAMLRERLILSIPMQPLCSEECQGLCQVCGQNLNVQRCGCEGVKTESPFASLQKAFKLSQKPLT
jgi:uncharacterized protein